MAEGCGCRAAGTETRAQRQVLGVALGLNAAMFAIGLAAGLIAQSSGLLADALDMLADAIAYGIALAAIDRGPLFKARSSLVSGAILLGLGALVLADVARRLLTGGAPESGLIIGVASLSLIVNASVLHMLGRYRRGEVHLRASWLFTRVDVVANLAVMTSGILVLFTGIRYLDLIVGAGIGLYVIREAIEIISDARRATPVHPA